MGLWDSIKNFFGFGSSGKNRLTSNRNYEPDKVKIAKISPTKKLNALNLNASLESN